MRYCTYRIYIDIRMNLEEKYPEAYFQHWIAMLSSMDTDMNTAGYKDQIKLYIQFEGTEEFEELISEVKAIKENGDLSRFMEVVKALQIDNIGENHLIEMVEVLLSES